MVNVQKREEIDDIIVKDIDLKIGEELFIKIDIKDDPSLRIVVLLGNATYFTNYFNRLFTFKPFKDSDKGIYNVTI